MIKSLLAWWARRRGKDYFEWRGRLYWSRDIKAGESVTMPLEVHQRAWAQQIERKVNGK